jgi:hypothetical protein
VAPQDPKFLQQEELTDRTAAIAGRGIRRVPMPASQGVYDPIRAEWVVMPRDTKAAKGLDFEPRAGGDRADFWGLRVSHDDGAAARRGSGAGNNVFEASATTGASEYTPHASGYSGASPVYARRDGSSGGLF